MKLFFRLGIGHGAALLGSIMLSELGLAQHVHSIPHTTTHYDTVRHGHHYHVVPHTTTHYHNVLHYGPDYPAYSNYSTYPAYTPIPSYSTYPNYSPVPIAGTAVSAGAAIVNNSPVVTVASQPFIAPAFSSPTRALKPNVLPYQGPGVKIILPKDVGGEINYLIDDVQEAKIKSGQQNVLAKKGLYEIRFSRGENEQGRDFGNAHYTISEGTYRFAVAKNGWELYREPDIKTDVEPTTAELNIKKNSLPAANPPSLPADQ
jgi:hypothetical protein